MLFNDRRTSLSAYSRLDSLAHTALRYRRKLHFFVSKPPPRVSQTEAKKAQWLAELANPDLPLESLSKLIPHGIRGKGLLQACTSRAIPIQRAKWIIQCVSINEVRGLQRLRGDAVVGYSQWFEEWSVVVCESYDETFRSAGASSQDSRLTRYLLRLMVVLLTDGLVNSALVANWAHTHTLHASDPSYHAATLLRDMLTRLGLLFPATASGPSVAGSDSYTRVLASSPQSFEEQVTPLPPTALVRSFKADLLRLLAKFEQDYNFNELSDKYLRLGSTTEQIDVLVDWCASCAGCAMLSQRRSCASGLLTRLDYPIARRLVLLMCTNDYDACAFALLLRELLFERIVSMSSISSELSALGVSLAASDSSTLAQRCRPILVQSLSAWPPRLVHGSLVGPPDPSIAELKSMLLNGSKQNLGSRLDPLLLAVVEDRANVLDVLRGILYQALEDNSMCSDSATPITLPDGIRLQLWLAHCGCRRAAIMVGEVVRKYIIVRQPAALSKQLQPWSPIVMDITVAYALTLPPAIVPWDVLYGARDRPDSQVAGVFDYAAGKAVETLVRLARRWAPQLKGIDGVDQQRILHVRTQLDLLAQVSALLGHALGDSFASWVQHVLAMETNSWSQIEEAVMSITASHAHQYAQLLLLLPEWPSLMTRTERAYWPLLRHASEAVNWLRRRWVELSLTRDDGSVDETVETLLFESILRSPEQFDLVCPSVAPRIISILDKALFAGESALRADEPYTRLSDALAPQLWGSVKQGLVAVYVCLVLKQARDSGGLPEAVELAVAQQFAENGSHGTADFLRALSKYTMAQPVIDQVEHLLELIESASLVAVKTESKASIAINGLERHSRFHGLVTESLGSDEAFRARFYRPWQTIQNTSGQGKDADKVPSALSDFNVKASNAYNLAIRGQR